MRLRGLLLDVGQTLLQTREPVGRTYARLGREHGLARSEDAVERAFRAAFREAGASRGLRYTGDGRPFWRRVVARSLGSEDPALFEALYDWYARPEAWTIAEGALDAIDALRAEELGVALVSDWDLRLRPLLDALGVLEHVDQAVISCEVGVEKPDPRIFTRACTVLGLAPVQVVHVGDDADRDGRGARLAGCTAWIWGHDVHSFVDVRDRLLGT